MLPRSTLAWLFAALALLFGFGSTSDRQVAADVTAEGTLLLEITPYIYTISANGENLRQLAYTGIDISRPQWSPDGQKIAYTADLDGNWEIFVVNVNGTGMMNLSQSPADEGLPRWSPDGTKILFVRFGDVDQVYKMNPDGTDQEVFSTELEEDFYYWSPTGETLIGVVSFYGYSALFLVSPDGHKLAQLTSDEILAYSPTWSPDGKRIAFLSKGDGTSDIYALNADGSELTQLTDTPEINEHGPAWSPDGRYIAYHIGDSMDVFPLYVMYPDGTNQVLIGDEGLLNNPWSYAWSPDGKYLSVSGLHPWEGSFVYIVDIACVDSPSGCGLADREYRPNPRIMVNILKGYPEITLTSIGPATSLSWQPIARSDSDG